MRAIQDKLREESGASLIIALVFFLVCLMVGSVVLTASTAAAGKLAQQRQNEQDYLTVASAAQLLKDRISALTYTHTRTLVDGTQTEKTSELACTGTGVLNNGLKALCEKLVEAPTELASLTPSFEISHTSGAGGAAVELAPVYGSLRMETDGRIFAKLWLGKANEADPENHNRMEIEFCPNGPVVTTSVTSEERDNGAGTVTTTITEIITTKYSWPEEDCIIRKGTA